MREKEDPIRPSHYAGHSIEPIKVIEDWSLGFHLGNVIKYLARHKRHKGRRRRANQRIEDLKKARWYLDRYIEVIEGA